MASEITLLLKNKLGLFKKADNPRAQNAQSSTYQTEAKSCPLTSERAQRNNCLLGCALLYTVFLKVTVSGHLSLISICHLLRLLLVRGACLN